VEGLTSDQTISLSICQSVTQQPSSPFQQLLLVLLVLLVLVLVLVLVLLQLLRSVDVAVILHLEGEPLLACGAGPARPMVSITIGVLGSAVPFSISKQWKHEEEEHTVWKKTAEFDS